MRLLPLLLIAVVAVRAQEPGPAPQLEPTISKKSGFVFELLPKAFASKPAIDMTVYGERTEYGRTLPDVAPDRPAYYVAQSLGFQPMGSSPNAGTPPSAEQIEVLLREVLEKRGYRFASELAHPPSLALTYYWGAHGTVDLRDVLDNPDLWPRRARDVHQRARLVGGKAFADKMEREMNYGYFPGQFTGRDEYLRFQVQNDLYYVVVSAYDFNLLAKGERRLVWRTTLTVNDQGVSMRETLPPLIASAVDYFGRDTGEAVALQRRISRGSVTLGPLMIIGEASAGDINRKDQ
jgi:hypothetical protein